ncbi:DMT family transporter [Rhodoferax aquaticus]|uniref:DMT family transporter n=1 Tax=Rhodoferax aquaticus TaxID=2527691 RepID=A0A515ES06_9BURK|nr:DMT family transporter [Rhodoferax aquaticus]QDL55452.1 DMT family transporter [Rhodoferax aquaticus]
MPSSSHLPAPAPRRFLDNPLLLLLATGSMLGLTFPLGKLSGTAGIAPVVWAFLISAGSGLVLSVVALLTRQAVPLNLRFGRYYLLAGIISYAIPNVLVFMVIPKLGAGLTSIMFTFSPIITLAIVVALRMQAVNGFGLAGIACGFVGAVLIVLSKGQFGAGALPAGSAAVQPLWLGVAFLIPMALACGNVYRTRDWPGQASGLALAVGTNLSSAAFLFVAAQALGHGFDWGPALARPDLVLAQVLASSAMFAVFFRLQKVGGPVYLSQMGYVAASIGLGAGYLFLGETYGLLTWAGALVVVLGVALSTLAQRRKPA